MLQHHAEMLMILKKPLRNLKNQKKNMLVSVTKSRKNPYFNMLEIKNRNISLVKKTSKQVVARQKSPVVYDMNASIYIWKRDKLLKSKIFYKKVFPFMKCPKKNR